MAGMSHISLGQKTEMMTCYSPFSLFILSENPAFVIVPPISMAGLIHLFNLPLKTHPKVCLSHSLDESYQDGYLN